MTPEQMEKRKRIMARSIALGHCICDPRKPCPCPLFKDAGVCECAGESLPRSAGPVRLTEYVRNVGCASKVPKALLREILAGLPEIDDPRVVVGRSAGDDAGVMLITPDLAAILTVDVFAPSVDDPYRFGQIAAANSISDVYAMGGTPQAALSILGVPVHALPPEAMRAILAGGVETLKEAGVPVVGGHSIDDEGVKCGFAVFGTAPAGGFVRNEGARVGDALVLTKPLGGGLIGFGHRIGRSTEEEMEAVAASMARLNRTAGREMLNYGVHAATDVTGFGLIGHLLEIAVNSGVEVVVDFDALPLFPGARRLATADVIPGAVERNREAADPARLDLDGLAQAQRQILFGPETSGGLLVALPPANAEKYLRILHDEGEAAAIVGHVAGPNEAGSLRATTAMRAAWEAETAAAAQAATIGVDGAQAARDRAPAALRTTSKTPPSTPTTDAGGGAACCAGGPPEVASPPSPTPGATTASPPAGPTGGDGAESGRFLAEIPPAMANAFKEYSAAVNAPGAIEMKEKKLMALALAVVTKCGPCVKIMTKAAREAGATEAELGEAAALGIAFGGASVNMFYNTLRAEG